MKLLLVSTAVAIALASPAAAQMDMNMPGMKMPPRPTAAPVVRAKPKAKPVKRRAPKARTRAKPAPAVAAARHPSRPVPHPALGHGTAEMPGMDKPPAAPAPAPAVQQAPAAPGHDVASMPGMDMGKPDTPVSANPHAGHDMTAMPGMSSGDAEIGTAPAPAAPNDHAADALFDPAVMARSRTALKRENGAFRGSMILFDLAEYLARRGGDGYRWESDAWFGGDIDRLQIKTEGEGSFGKSIDDFEVQALYSRAISPFWNAHVGIRHDIAPHPSRSYAVVGVEGIAPYWLHLTGQLFLSDKGNVRVRLEGSYDERITQKLIFRPRFEMNLSAQDMPAIGVGSGLTSFELGARLRYELRKEFAPYIGVEWSGQAGDTARYTRLSGDKPNAVNVVAGIRFWF